jgi:uncharacterized protein (TIGR02594 family)
MIRKFILAAVVLLGIGGYEFSQQGPHTPLEWAYSQVGINISDPLVMDFIHSEPNGYEGETDTWVEENGWCGFFVSWCLLKSGYRAPEHPMSGKYWRESGIPIELKDVRPGDVVLIPGHVAFVYSVDLELGTIVILGGNQEYLNGPPAGVNFMEITFADVLYVIRPVKVQDHPGHNK